MTNNKVIKGKIQEEKFEWYRKKPVPVRAYQTDEELDIETLEGTMRADKGDFIIQGVKGEPYPCKPDIFDMTYEKVDAPVVPDKMLNISEGLLEDIRHELASISKWYAFQPTHDINLEEDGHTLVNNKDFLVQLDFEDLIKKIDKVLE